jgi:organic hydroperoxide reductase OsmC/OhrA
MLGTLNGALEVRGIRLDPEDILAEVEGVNRLRGGIPLLEEIVVHYRLRIPAEVRGTVDRALEQHASKCPSALALQGAIEVRWTADIEEKVDKSK